MIKLFPMKKLLLLTLNAIMVTIVWAGDIIPHNSQTITANDATNERVPIYGKFCDEYSQSQFIIPATELEDILDATINGVTFYASTSVAINWENALFDVYLKEVANTIFANKTYEDWITMTKVYSGSLSIGSNGKMEIDFSNPYEYHGGNLLVGIDQTTRSTGGHAGCEWIGTTVSGASLGGNQLNNGVEQQNFLPRYTFDYTEGDRDGIEMVTANADNWENTCDWFTIDGRKLSCKPTTKGIYLNIDSRKARKVVVRN